MSKKVSNSPFGLLYIICQTAFVTMKLTGVINWSWWLVTMPTIIYIGGGFLTLLVILAVLVWVLKRAPEEQIELAKRRGAFSQFLNNVLDSLDKHVDDGDEDGDDVEEGEVM